MRQPDQEDIGTKRDLVKHQLQIAKEDLETASLIFTAGKNCKSRRDTSCK